MKRSRAAFWIATWFGCGLVKKGPGTAGSAAALGLAWIAHEVWGAAQLSMLTAALIATAAGVWASARVAAELSVKDPQLVVIDEVAGQWLTLAGAVAYNWRSFVLAFALFRILDIIKPPPARQMESLRGGVGVMADDIMAGAYAALVLYAAGCFNLY